MEKVEADVSKALARDWLIGEEATMICCSVLFVVQLRRGDSEAQGLAGSHLRTSLISVYG